ncbi:MAG: porin [Verrucomicrobia bacterium]|nr:porin [Verrucomicrobiota bacterium]
MATFAGCSSVFSREYFRTLVCLVGFGLLSVSVHAQESGPLVDLLIKKGILTNQEAEELRAELVRESNTVPAHAFGGGKATDRLSVGMRMQIQYAHIDTEIKGTAAKPAYVDQAFLRRMYFTLKAGVGGHWGAQFTYDFASGYYDDGYIDWKPTPDLQFNFGLRKVAVAYEERYSSGNLKALERSGVTRYFVEGNNGRRLGAASYRIGAFLDGKKEINSTTNFLYTAAITDPERSESFTEASAAGDSTSNKPAFWGTVALYQKLPENNFWTAGVGSGFQPDRGGFGTTNFGRGFDLTLYSAFFELQAGRFAFMAEYLTADVEGGVSATRDARPKGYFLMPSYYLTETIEAVARYCYVDSNGRGLQMGDVMRSAASGGTMNKFEEWYAGVNWYLRGIDLRWQLGAMYGKTRENVTGAPAEAKAVGMRSQVQIQF